MNIIVVDDEPLALRDTARLVRDSVNEGEGEVREFLLPRQALAFARGSRVDVAFLDIEMPGMSGLELAKALKEENPDARIVFVTSYDRYAVDAFAVRATGYLLKPARPEDVRRELTFIYDERRERSRLPGTVCVRTFGGFEVEVDGVPLSFKRSKSKELFALLVDRRGCGVTTREACAVLWEDVPYSTSQRSYFQNVVADLRAALAAAGVEAVLVRSRNNLAIDPALIDSDSYRFLEGDPAAVNSYHGDYLPAYSWAEYSAGPFMRMG